MGIEVNVMFPARLRTLMQKGIDGKRVTQQDLATATGYTRQAISLYLDGSVLPNVEKLCAIAEYFGVSADYLLGLSDTSTSDKDVFLKGTEMELQKCWMFSLTMKIVVILPLTNC